MTLDLQATVKGGSKAFSGVTGQGDMGGGVIEQVVGLFQEGGMIEDHQVALARRQNGHILPAQVRHFKYTKLCIEKKKKIFSNLSSDLEQY